MSLEDVLNVNLILHDRLGLLFVSDEYLSYYILNDDLVRC